MPASRAGRSPAGPGVEVVENQLEVTLEPRTARVLLLKGPGAAQHLPVPTSGVEDAVERFTRRLLLASLGLFGGALLIGVVVAHRFTRPLRDLATAARQVGEGELGVAAPDAPGEVGDAIAAFNQMSARLRELDQEARRLRASEGLSELGEVGRGLAHSLRNPLNALGLAVDELAREAGTEEAAETAEAARRQIRRVDAALRGFLALSAGEAAPAAVDLGVVARDVALESLQSRPGGGAVPVEVAAPDGSLALRGVEAELRAALQALVVNAVEASPPGGRVRVTLERDGDAVAVRVDDEGPGLPDAVRARLFTPHVTTKPSGAGVGLYLAHRLATTRYAGDLRLADRPGGGTRATLLLRDRRATGSPAAPGAAATAPLAAAPDREDAGGG
jgi:signal transduction histidine kinase